VLSGRGHFLLPIIAQGSSVKRDYCKLKPYFFAKLALYLKPRNEVHAVFRNIPSQEHNVAAYT